MKNQEHIAEDTSIEKKELITNLVCIEVEDVFSSKDEIETLLKQAEEGRWYMKGMESLVQKVETLKKQRKEFYLTFDEISEILEWRYRLIWSNIIVPSMKKKINKKNIELILKTVYAIKDRNEEKETALRLALLKTLGLSVTRASNLLAVWSPKKYPILNWSIWRGLYKDDIEDISIEDYLHYMKDNAKIATKFGVTLEQVSCALWQKWDTKH